MDGRERSIIEETIVSCVLCSEDCARIAAEVLPLKPFRSPVAEDLHVLFYWALGQLEHGTFDGLKNPDRLAQAIADEHWKGWDWSEPEVQAWVDSFWSPLMYDPEGFRSLCVGLRDENLANDELIRANRANEENRYIHEALNYDADFTGAPKKRTPAGPHGIDL